MARRSYPDRRKPSFFWLMAALVSPPMSLLVKYEMHGSLPATGPVILAPNHYSDFDPVVNGLAVWRLGRKPRFLAKASLFRVPVVSWFLRTSGQIPVERDRNKQRTDSMGPARELVQRQSLVIVYPEGTLTREPDCWPMRGKAGAVRLALESGAPLIPMASWGAQELVPRFSKKFRFRFRQRVVVRIGEPLDLSAYQGKATSRREVAATTERLMDEITKLLEEIRGEQAPAHRYDPANHGETEFGLPEAMRAQRAAKPNRRLFQGRRR